MRFLGFLFVALFNGSTSIAQSYDGNNPVLAFNLSAVRDWGTAMPFIDIMRFRRDWIGHKDGGWGGVTFDELANSGLFDSDGWPIRIPQDVDSIGTIFAWSDASRDPAVKAYLARDYYLRYRGQGVLELRGAEVLSQTAGPDGGQIRFSYRGGRNLDLRISSTDPHGNGNYIRDITVVPIEFDPYFQAGAIFNPDWISLVKDSRQIRFMDWMETNNSEPHNYFEVRPQSAETMVRLSNEVGAEPWFTMAHNASDAEIQDFAEFVATHLDPELSVRVEYSNEVWNNGFEQSRWVFNLAQMKGDDDYSSAYIDRAARILDIWRTAFADVGSDRVIGILATQTANIDRTTKLVDYATASGGIDDFDELAVTTYFGALRVQDDNTFGDLRSVSYGEQGYDWLLERLYDPTVRNSLPDLRNLLESQKAIAESAGLRLVAYEGGQHILQTFNRRELTSDDRDRITAYLGSFVDSNEMAGAYEDLWSIWSEIGEGPFMHYSDVTPVSRSGAWGLYRNLTEPTPVSRSISSLANHMTPWWDATPCTCFGQGVYAFAVNGVATGTPHEDYLVGSYLDDRFLPMQGEDGIFGGDGIDTVVLNGQASDYSVEKNGEFCTVRGADGTYNLKSVELLAFDDGIVELRN